ncbi:MAG: hypothetical protein WC310_01635 [Patescibacteria group bacterium]|jgi:hypothetical protein
MVIGIILLAVAGSFFAYRYGHKEGYYSGYRDGEVAASNRVYSASIENGATMVGK